MGRFTASKYKNAAAKKLKREDTAFGFRIGELCQNDPIACGADKVAFTGEAAGVSILDTGELGNVQPRSLRGHHEYVRCLEFNPFNKDCLCTCAGDGMVKLWNTSTMTCTTTLNVSEQVHMTRFHPVAENLLLSAEHDKVRVYDILREKEVFCSPDSLRDLQCSTVSWSYDGKLACAAGKSGQISVIDVRSGSCIASAKLYSPHKDLHHEWLGVDKLVLAGFKGRDRVFQTVDISDLSNAISSIDLGTGSGTPFVKYDHDTRMMFLYAKGDHGYSYCEVGSEGVMKENWKENCNDVIKGIALTPKTSLDAMSGEVVRLMILHQTSLSPTPFIVPRKSYKDFHADLFPDTRGPVPGVDGESWMNGKDGYRELVSLDPAAAKKAAHVENGGVSTSMKLKEQKAEEPKEPVVEVEVVEENGKHKKILSNLTEGQSPYRNIEGQLAHRDTHYHGLRNVQSVLPQETDGLQVGKKFGALLMTDSGGRLGVFNLDTPGLNNTPQLEIVNVGNPIVFQWDPFSDKHVLAVGGDCAQVKLWEVEDVTIPANLLCTLEGHSSKVVLMSYHPAVAGLLATCDSAGNLILWDTLLRVQLQSLDLSSENGCVAMCWDTTDGYTMYITHKTGRVLSCDFRTKVQKSVELNVEMRTARMAATKDVVVVSGFVQGNNRFLYVLSHSRGEFTLYDTHDLDIGTSLCIPFVDVDRNLAFLAARGEATVLPFELRAAPPHILPLAQFSCSPVQYAVTLITKTVCNVMDVEIARFYKLCRDSVQLFSLFVPRLKKEYFQDDLFPMTIDLTSPVLSADEWKQGKEYKLRRLDLCPDGVKRFSEVEVVRTSSQQSKIQQEHLKYKSHEAQRDELFNAFAEQIQQTAGPLVQDTMEGCDEDEWSD